MLLTSHYQSLLVPLLFPVIPPLSISFLSLFFIKLIILTGQETTHPVLVYLCVIPLLMIHFYFPSINFTLDLRKSNNKP
jgi:hypothetical protein